jgi:N-acetylglucosaminyl-diphospho-decaprenol L-rhamnosyltransferase
LPFSLEVRRNDSPLGFGENHNRAFAYCRTEYFAVLNPDLRVLQNPFPALSRCLADGAVGVAAPVVREADGVVADFVRPLVSPWEVLRRRFGVIAPTDLDVEPEWIAGMFLAFRREVYAELGGFDPRYFLYCEDVDLCARARLRGLRLQIARDAFVTHHAQRASRRSLGRMGVHIWSLMRLWSSPAYRRYRALLRAPGAG